MESPWKTGAGARLMGWRGARCSRAALFGGLSLVSADALMGADAARRSRGPPATGFSTASRPSLARTGRPHHRELKGEGGERALAAAQAARVLRRRARLRDTHVGGGW
eukprot:480827-Prymnesium_polylepis.1